MCAEIVSVVNQVFRYALDSLSMSTATEGDEVKPQFKQNYNSWVFFCLHFLDQHCEAYQLIIQAREMLFLIFLEPWRT